MSGKVGGPPGYKRRMVQQAAGEEDRADEGVPLADAVRQAGHLRPPYTQHPP